MLNPFQKDIVREILNTLGRFLGIFAIVALGVSFYAGLGATGPDMKRTGDAYFRAQNLMDIRVIGTYGLTDSDIAALRKVPGVRQVFPTYTADAQFEMAEDSVILKLHGLDTSAAPSEWISRPLLMNGRYPERADEILVEGGFLWMTGLSIGDRITLESGKTTDLRQTLTTKTFLITGTARTPVYMSHERGSGSIGTGAVDAFAFIPCDAFKQPVYGEAFVTLTDTQAISCFSDEYEDILDAAIDTLEGLGEQRSSVRLTELTSKAYARLRAAQADLDEQIRLSALQFDEAEAQLIDAQRAQNAARTDVSTNQGDITTQITELNLAETQIFSGIRSIQAGLDALDVQERELRDQLIALDETEAALRMQVRTGLSDIAAGLAEINIGRQSLEEGLRAISDTRVDLTLQQNELRREQITVQNGKSQLQTAQAQLGSAGTGLLSADLSIREQSDALTAQRTEAEAAFADAQAAITAQLDTLNDMDTPEWYVLDRGANPGYTSFVEDTDKVQAIGRVFPLIFFIVAALVSLTTMTRLVEERRTEIGTLKSLGYGNMRIASKYLIYAITPTLLGGLIGGFVGMKLFPGLIINAYGILYTLPPPITPIHYGYWATSIGMAVACTVLAALFACLHELRAVPSQLMRPKAPKSGKRTFLERIPALWRAFSFTYKVTIRNLTRYKKRFLMTVVGISGCTALLVTGFGLQDSVSDIIGLQFGEINQYNMTVSFRDSATAGNLTTVSGRLASSAHMKSQMFARQKTIDAGASLSNTKMANLVVPESAETLERFITFRERLSHAPLSFSDDGVIITEKLARELDLSVGDEIVLDADDKVVTVPVTAITEHYFLHYVYMPPDLYATLFGEPAAFNTIFGYTTDESKSARNELASLVLDETGVSSIFFSKATKDTFTDIISSLNFVIVVLIVSAGALAFVVLLNLTNINISERIRELATIAVLGFTDGEISAYVFRENAALTAIGAGIGLFFGKFLHGYVLQTVETDMFMFGMQIQPMSFVYSVLLTFLFSAMVNVFTGGKLKKIDMVEALKSVE